MARGYSKRGVSLAQSGGINHTFGGGKGGTKQSKVVTRGRIIGRTTWNGLSVAIRSPFGNLTTRRSTGKAGAPPPVRGGGRKLKKVHVNPPVRGGH